MAKYLDPKNEVVFKRIFKTHPDLLIGFLNALIPLENEEEIKSVEYQPFQWAGIYPEEDYTVVDVQCKNNKGQRIIVETQLIWNATPRDYQSYFADRANRYLLSMDTYSRGLKTIYCFDIINSNIDYEKEEHYSHLRLVRVNKPDNSCFYDGVNFVIVELKKFKPGTHPACPTADLWLRFLREMDGAIEKAPEDLLAVAEIREAIGLCEAGCYTPDELAAYEKQREIVTLVEKKLLKWEAEAVEKMREKNRPTE